MSTFARSMGCIGVALLGLSGCAEETLVETTQVPIVVDGTGLSPCMTNLGYSVTITDARMVIEDLDFMVGGQPHGTSWLERISELLVPTAYAHPEHMLGGNVAGGLEGRFVIDWLRADRTELGFANLEVRTFASANFNFARAGEQDGLPASDPLLGHTAVLSGTAMREGDAIAFTVVLDSPLDRRLIGAPFQVDVIKDDPRRIGMQLLAVDPMEGDTLFDDVDFEALDARNVEPVALREDTADVAMLDAYYAVRRRFQTHDHFALDALR